jgi:hypothetical protein
MRTPCLSLLLTLAVAGSSTAQVGAGYGVSVPGIPAWIIFNAFNVVQGNDIRQVSHMRLGNNADGVWTSALAVGGLPAFWGGDGAHVNPLIGIFDPYNGTFTSTQEAKNLCSSTEDTRHISLSPDGLWAIIDRPSGVYLGSRASVGTQFGAPVPVAGFGALTDVYPALGPVDGQTMCFYTDKTKLIMQPIDLANATLTGSPTTVSFAVQPGAQPISPTPVFGADGEVKALWAADLVTPKTGSFTGDADPIWLNDLVPSTPGIVMVENPEWQCCGGIAGGFVYFTHDIPPGWHTMHSEGAWLAGDWKAPGEMMTITTAAPNYSAPQPLFTNLLLAIGEGPQFPIPAFRGTFALNAAGMAPFAVPFQTNTKEGIASLSFTLANDPTFHGVSIAIQALVSNFTTGIHIFTNTAWLHIK